MANGPLLCINNIVAVMLENRSFDPAALCLDFSALTEVDHCLTNAKQFEASRGKRCLKSAAELAPNFIESVRTNFCAFDQKE